MIRLLHLNFVHKCKQELLFTFNCSWSAINAWTNMISWASIRGQIANGLRTKINTFQNVFTGHGLLGNFMGLGTARLSSDSFFLCFFYQIVGRKGIRPLEEFELLGLASVRLKMGNIKQKYSFLIHIQVLSPWNKCKHCEKEPKTPSFHVVIQRINPTRIVLNVKLTWW